MFFIIPELIQKPFRIGLGFFFAYYAIVLFYNRKISLWLFAKIGIIISLVALIIIKSGNFHTSMINVALCTFGFYTVNNVNFRFHQKDRNFNILFYLALLSMTVQLLFLRTEDGRPNLSYEINLSGAYLFLFFLLSNLAKKKIGVIFVIATSFLLLSRLLIFSITLYYIVYFLRNIIPKIIFKCNFRIIYALLIIIFLSFNAWFLVNVEIGSSYNTSSDRITELNDGSNKLRFLINIKVLGGLFEEKDENLMFGYGQVSEGKNYEYEKKYKLMPHNELLVSVVEFGYIFTFFVFFLVLAYYNSYFDRKGIVIIAPLLLYSLILWVRFFLIPSFEMIFIILLLKINKQE